MLSSSSKHEYTIYQGSYNNKRATLKKIIKNNGGNIASKNYLKVDSTEIDVPFEDIDSFYTDKYEASVLICPKGKFHPYNFYSKVNIQPPSSNFQEKGNWDLKCYDHFTGHFLVFYFQNKYYNFYSKCADCNSDNGIKRNSFIDQEIYDYQLENGNNGNNYGYKFPTLEKNDNYLKLYLRALSMNYGDANVNCPNKNEKKKITKIKKFTQAYFNSRNCFHYFTYNNIYDFTSGFSTTCIDINDYGSYNDGSINVEENKSLPLSFLDNIEIIEMKFIIGTKHIIIDL